MSPSGSLLLLVGDPTAPRDARRARFEDAPWPPFLWSFNLLYTRQLFQKPWLRTLVALQRMPLHAVVGSTAVREPSSTRDESLIDLNLRLDIYKRY